MKRTHIIALVFVAVLVASLTVMLGKGFSRYESFESAHAKEGKEFTVVGYMNKIKGVTYKPEINPNQFSIYVKDEKNVERLVVVNKAVPRDIEKSEKVVVTGKMSGNTFVASDILLKCPSKYKNRELEANNGKSI
ncbi:MAG: cytochrome c maturation protein CcmE [Chitinophagales bacterium]|jgi:cytochrome c-type biogenesis protein CcmE|nr:cytochrome c maturation protein CcmE [Chitinophagales bacterium]MBP6154762.1 cytochrome c maturation protein CcmE [Chitinophagales bacterium]HQV78952.1 cytochrome c maturation protein CcmE [Chitinophagales bacterium]HQW68173.1 cytochrome c maturation protein CcmE [Flavobacterium sp.]HQW68216.1 cytochrome c maturation protein CcmE [Flavobacterium sp.]